MKNTIAELRAAGNIAAIGELIPYARTVGLETYVDDIGIVTVLRFRETNIGNPRLRAIHGGVLAALLEHAGVMLLLSETDLNVVPKIVNVSVDYLRSCAAADVFARGRIIRQGRRVANVRVEAWQDDPERPVAAAHAHFLVAPPSPAAE